MPAYATGQDLMNLYDAEMIAQAASRNGVQVQLADIPTNPVVLAMLNRGANDINMATLVSMRYSLDDLAALAASTDESIRMSIASLNADLAFGYLMQGKATTPSELAALAAGFEPAKQILQLLRTGERVFPLVPQELAGVKITRLQLGQNPAGLCHITSTAIRFFGPLTSSPPDRCGGCGCGGGWG